VKRNKQIDGLTPEWDELLNSGLVQVPADFHVSVMQRVEYETQQLESLPSSHSYLINALQAVAVLVGIFATGWQTLGFVFSLWATTVAF